MSIINKIKLSGTSYDIQDSNAQPLLVSGTNIKTINNESLLGSGNITIQGGGGNNVIEVTQAEYDALVSAGTLDLTALYVITDATEIDINNYWTSAQTQSAITESVSGKQDTLIAGYNITISGNVISASGGGKSISAGTNISVTTGETADTISCTLPITASTSVRKNDITIGNDVVNGASNLRRLLIGNGNKFNYSNSRTSDSILIGTPNSNSSIYNTVNAPNCIAIGGNGIEVGYDNIYGYGSIGIGYGVKSLINGSLAIGYNAVASGTTKTNINNQLTIDTSNQVYIYNKDNTEMICLQDNLGGGEVSSAITSGDTNAVAGGAVFEQLGGLKFVSLTQTEYNLIQNKDANTLYIITSGQTCTPTSTAFTNVNEQFSDFSSPVYELKFDFGWIVAHGDPTDSVSTYIYDAPSGTTGRNQYYVDVSYNDGSAITSLNISSGGTSIYTALTLTSEITVDLCQVFGQGMYLDSESIPYVVECIATECTEFECYEWDEETGDCIEQGSCIQEECVDWQNNYVMYVKL